MRPPKIILTLFAVLIFASAPASAHQPLEESGRSIVECYTSAYNAGDTEAMGALMHDDIQWLTVKEDKVTITTQGKVDMMQGLRGYFKSPTSISSRLSGWGENGDFISVVEIASWTTKSGEKRAQSSSVIYQIENGLIRRVWYFPEQPNTPRD